MARSVLEFQPLLSQMMMNLLQINPSLAVNPAMLQSLAYQQLNMLLLQQSTAGAALFNPLLPGLHALQTPQPTGASAYHHCNMYARECLWFFFIV